MSICAGCEKEHDNCECGHTTNMRRARDNRELRTELTAAQATILRLLNSRSNFARTAKARQSAVQAEIDRLRVQFEAIEMGLDFKPSDSRKIADMANVGNSLMDALPKDYFYNNSPAEIVVDLSNRLYDAEAERDKLLQELEEKKL